MLEVKKRYGRVRNNFFQETVNSWQFHQISNYWKKLQTKLLKETLNKTVEKNFKQNYWKKLDSVPSILRWEKKN